MSLLRITSHGSLSPERSRSPAGEPIPRYHKLSFNPLPGSGAPAPLDIAKPVGAFEVPRAKRIWQVAIAVLYCFLTTGIIFGYAALKPVLIREGVYRDLCTEDELKRGVRTCYDQEIRLNLMFTVAAVGTNFAALPVGAILDKFGPQICGVIGSFVLAVGALLFAFAPQLPFDGYLSGYLLLAIGGPFVYISSFHLSNAFPNNSGLILALLTGAFDASPAIFLVYRIIYAWSEGTYGLEHFFVLYLALPVFILAVQLSLMPKASYKTVAELVEQAEEADDVLEDEVDNEVDENTALLVDEHRQRQESVISEVTDLIGSKSGAKHRQKEDQKNRISGVWGAMHTKSVRKQLLSPWFILITLFTAIQMTRNNYFVATIRQQYRYLLGSYEKAVEVNTFFDIALPLGGILATPFIGLVLDRTSTLTVLLLLVSIATTIGVLGCLPYSWAAYSNVSLYVVYRPFYYTAVSDYSAKVFGFRTFGTVYGAIICISGLFNFSQSGLDVLLHKTFKGNPVPVNLILLVVCVVAGVALCIYVGTRAYKIRREGLEEEAENAREIAMPGAEMPERL